jgi:sulfur-oxidizing protein SoxB
MITRRDLLVASAALAPMTRAKAEAPSQAELLRFAPLGQVTLIHITDLHGQLMPMFFREASANIGVGEARGKLPHITGPDFLAEFGITRGTALAHALTHLDFAALAKRFGPMGGVDRMASIIKSIRAERAGRVLLLDGGDTWQGAWTNLQTQAADMVAVQKALGIDAMVGHWEFTYGADRVTALTKELPWRQYPGPRME